MVLESPSGCDSRHTLPLICLSEGDPSMYRKDDTSYFIVDAHVALWDARPENQRNIHGKQFIDCFYDYHRNLSPESEVWSYEEYLYQGGDRLMKDLFTDGYVDHAIFQPAFLGEFYYKGFRADRTRRPNWPPRIPTS